MSTSARRRHQGGFMLIEVLIGLALLALTVALLPSGLRLGLKAWTSRGDLDRMEGLAMTVNALEQRISQALPLFERDKRGGVRVLFEGDHSTLSFVGPVETGPAGSGLFHARLAPHSSSADGAGLTIELSPYAAQPPERRAAPTLHVVAGADVVFRYRYFGVFKSGAAPQWHTSWQRANELPMLVEVTAELRTSGGRAHVHRQVIVPRIGVRS